jgi:tRNA threonylcarbamoyl adenosine modification protein YeaZ
MERGHGTAIMPMIQKAVNESNFSLSDFTCIAVTIGPGSFTGLRIAMAAAKGLAISNSIPLVGISCFEAVAQRMNERNSILSYDLLLIVLNSKREDLYIECRDPHNEKLIPGGVINSDAFFSRLKKMVHKTTNIQVVGDGANQLLERVPSDINSNFLFVKEEHKEPVDACDVAYCASKEKFPSTENIEKRTPRVKINYLRSPDITLSNKI